MDSIHFTHGSAILLDNIQDLWEELNKHHELVSKHFKDDFQAYTFQQRKAKLIKKYTLGKLRVDIAKDKDRPVGYIISAISEDSVGEIESIYIQKDYRGKAIGDELMGRALAWLVEGKVNSMVVDVAVGNEEVYNFYAQYGFHPRISRLKHKGTDIL
jgi:ribosomal protein S18 acetylase RimI-like enzyme